MTLYLLLAAAMFAVIMLVIGLGLPLLRLTGQALPPSERTHFLSQGPLAPIHRLALQVLAGRWQRRKQVLDQQLILAGRPFGDLNGADYLAFVVITGIAVALVLLLLFGAALQSAWAALVPSLGGGALAALLLLSWLKNAVVQRRIQIERQFPYFLDLAVMALRAGASLAETMDIYQRNNPRQALSQELSRSLNEVRMGRPLVEAMDALVNRLASEQVQGVVRTIARGIRLGSALANLFEEQASGIRYIRTQQAERAAEELKIRILGPSMLMMIAVFILILGPALISIVESGAF